MTGSGSGRKLAWSVFRWHSGPPVPGCQRRADHRQLRGPGVQRCNRLGTNVIPGTTRYLLGCACGQELVRSVVHNDIDTFARW